MQEVKAAANAQANVTSIAAFLAPRVALNAAAFDLSPNAVSGDAVDDMRTITARLVTIGHMAKAIGGDQASRLSALVWREVLTVRAVAEEVEKLRRKLRKAKKRVKRAGH